MADRWAIVLRRGLLFAGALVAVLIVAGLAGILLSVFGGPLPPPGDEPDTLALALTATPTAPAPLFPVTGPTAAPTVPPFQVVDPAVDAGISPAAAPARSAASPAALAGPRWGEAGSLFDRRGDGRRALRLPSPTPSPAPAAPAAPTAQPSPRVPTRIVARSIGLDAPIAPVGWKMVNSGGKSVPAWVVPDRQVGWHKTSAPPGQVGNTVLTGHRNLYNEVFRYLPDLQIGDSILVYVGDVPFEYKVAEMHVVQEVGVPASVRAENARWIARTDDLRLTLVTCWPYQAPGNTHRLIVVARP